MLTAYLLNYQENKSWWLPMLSLKWTQDLHQGATGQIKVAYNNLKEIARENELTVKQLLNESLTKIVLYDEQNENKVFKGVITGQTLSGSSLGDLQLTLNFADPRVLLNKILTGTNQSYSETNLEDMAESLIDQAQQKNNLGITVVKKTLSNYQLDRTFKNERVWEAMMSLSSLKMQNGLEMSFDPDWKLELSWPNMGQVKNEVVFDAYNIVNFSSRLNLGGSLTNRVYIKGKNEQDSQVYQDNEAQAIWGVAESYVSATDLSEETALRARAMAFLAENGTPFTTTQIDMTVLANDPDWQSYQVGDQVKLKIEELDLNQLWRVYKKTLNLNEGVSKLEITVSKQAKNNDFLTDYKELNRRIERLERN